MWQQEQQPHFADSINTRLDSRYSDNSTLDLHCPLEQEASGISQSFWSQHSTTTTSRSHSPIGSLSSTSMKGTTTHNFQTKSRLQSWWMKQMDLYNNIFNSWLERHQPTPTSEQQSWNTTEQQQHSPDSSKEHHPVLQQTTMEELHQWI